MFLMNMIRGTGLSGLKGIDISRNKIVRPLLEITRAEIEEYCHKENLKPFSVAYVDNDKNFK